MGQKIWHQLRQLTWVSQIIDSTWFLTPRAPTLITHGWFIQGIWIGTPWSAPLQNSRSFWIAGLRLHSTKMSAECRVKWSVIWHSKGLHSSPRFDHNNCSLHSRISTDIQVYFHSNRLGFQSIFSFYSKIDPSMEWRVDWSVKLE